MEERIEELYEIYRNTMPMKGGESKWFKALEFDEIGDDEIVLDVTRKEAKEKLEDYVRQVGKDLKYKGWFWQSSKYPELVILRDWFN